MEYNKGTHSKTIKPTIYNVKTDERDDGGGGVEKRSTAVNYQLKPWASGP